MSRRIVVTSALPYANGPIHIGHLVEYVQTDIWVRFQKLRGNQCLYFCADDTHGTPIMLSARAAGIEPEVMIERMHARHKTDFDRFAVEFDNYYSTHSPENRYFSELIFKRLSEASSIVTRDVEQTYCERCAMPLPDRYVRGTCPRCKAEDQYGDSCEVCSATYRTTDLIRPRCATCGATPVSQTSRHYFFKLADYEQPLRDLMAAGYAQQSVANKLDEWFTAGLRDWDISRDGPYFGFQIPGEPDKYFYVWLDAPIGYMASCKNYCDAHGLDFEQIWPGDKSRPGENDEWELYHFIGKDIMYFHALFWPAMLIGAGFKTARRLFVHGFLTVNGQKMSKSRGTFINAATYARHLDPEFLRYYYASKLTDTIDDIDLSIDDFVNRMNADLVGKYANLASRSVPMLTKKLGGRLGRLDEQGGDLVRRLAAARESVADDYEALRYAAAIRTISALADEANRYVEQKQPWTTIRTDPELTRTTLTAVLNAVRILTIYLKPVLPVYAGKIERMLKVPPLTFADVDKALENHDIAAFERLFERIDVAQVDAMIEESKQGQPAVGAPAQQPPIGEPIREECTIEDFMKVDLRIARVLSAERVEGADKLLKLELDVGVAKKTVFAGIAKAYEPQSLVGRLVVCLANLKPRKMRFGVSEGMVLASGPGDKDIFMLSVDDGAAPGQQVK